MYSLPPAVLFNEKTGRLELQHAEIVRRVRRTQRLRSRYRSTVVRRALVAIIRAPWRALIRLSDGARRRGRVPRASAPTAAV